MRRCVKCNHTPAAGSLYCESHRDTCRSSRCMNDSVNGSNFCAEHKCAIATCDERFNGDRYCREHECYRCDDAWVYKQRNRRVCEKHKKYVLCTAKRCTEPRWYDALFCKDHKCTVRSCEKKRHKKSQCCIDHVSVVVANELKALNERLAKIEGVVQLLPDVGGDFQAVREDFEQLSATYFGTAPADAPVVMAEPSGAATLAV